MGKEREDALCATIPAQTYSMSQCMVIERAATQYLSPTDVEEFRTVVLGAGTRLASLLTGDYPRADLVSEALDIATGVAEGFSL